MTSPNFSVAPKRSKRVPLIVLAVLIVAGAIAGVVAATHRSGSGNGSAKASKSPKAPTLNFFLSAFEVQTENDTKPAPSVVDRERRAVYQLVTDFYFRTFVNPGVWSDPTFQGQDQIFTPEARTAFLRDINALTIGEGKNDFKKVNVKIADLKISVYFDKANNPAFSVAVVKFRADGVTKDKKHVDIVQDATYDLQRVGTAWKVFSYSANQKQDAVLPTPSPSGSTK